MGQERIFVESRYVETTSEDYGSCVHNKNVSRFSLSFIQVDENNSRQFRYATVLQQTTSLYRDMVQKEGWEGKTDFVVDSVNRLTLRVRITPDYVQIIIIYLKYTRSHFWS